MEGEVEIYQLTNGHGLSARVMTYGATLVSLEVPGRDGRVQDVVLGFDSLDGYLRDTSYFGATVGRVGNRIRGARFELENERHAVAVNDGTNHLHGGLVGWDKVVWAAEPMETRDGPALRLTYLSKDGEEGYPGNVGATCTYTLTTSNELRVVMTATTDKTTLLNMVHHTYWNLSGEGAGLIMDHRLTLHATHYTPGDPQVPTGAVLPVAGTPYDFRAAKPVGKDLLGTRTTPVGYDHNFVVDGPPSEVRPVAVLHDPRSGRVMRLASNQPGVQFYSGNFLDGTVVGKSGRAYPQHSGLCLETQAFPNAINVAEWRPQVILRPGQTYTNTMIHGFAVE